MRIVFQMSLEVGGFVEEDPEEEVGVEVTVDRDFVESVVGTRPTIIAQFRHALAGDMEMDTVKVQVAVHPIHRLSRQVVSQYAAIFRMRGSHNGSACVCAYWHCRRRRCTPRLRQSAGSGAEGLFFVSYETITAEKVFYCGVHNKKRVFAL